MKFEKLLEKLKRIRDQNEKCVNARNQLNGLIDQLEREKSEIPFVREHPAHGDVLASTLKDMVEIETDKITLIEYTLNAEGEGKLTVESVDSETPMKKELNMSIE